MESIWTKEVRMPEKPMLEGEEKTDVLIIGAGLAGVLCAHRLQRAGVDCAVLEAMEIGSGVTQNTTAKISTAHGLIYHKLLRRFGRERARLYFEANERALEEYRLLCAEIPCDFEETNAYIYACEHARVLEEELYATHALDIPAHFVPDVPLPLETKGALQYTGQAQCHPLKFLSALARPLRIYEHSRVRELTPHRAVTERGAITAKHIVVATHFPFLNKHGGYFLKQYQHRSYVLALENAPQPPGMYRDGAENGLSFRNYKHLLLLGGGGHRTGKRGAAFAAPEQFAKTHYPNAREVARFATQDCMTLDGMPYIGRYGAHTPTLYVATGFNKWGMTGAMAAAMLLEDMILERSNPFTALFAPQRSSFCPQLGINAFEAASGLLFPSRHRCPHLGCALRWNAAEHSWDCPCHGSRFDEHGVVLNNPANENLHHKP